MLQYRLFVPDRVRDSRVVLIGGANIGDSFGGVGPADELGNLHGKTDATRKAQAIARQTGFAFLGYNAPGRGDLPFANIAWNEFGPDNFDNTMAEHGAQLQHRVSELGFSSPWVVEHSLGNISGLGAVASGELHADEVIATEPSLLSHPFFRGLLKLHKARTHTERLHGHNLPPKLADELHNVRPTSPARTARDILLYGGAVRLPKALQYLVRIGLDLPETGVMGVLAEHGHNPPDEVKGIVTRLNSLRQDRPGFAPFEVQTVQGATHALFDRSQVVAGLVNEVAKRRLG